MKNGRSEVVNIPLEKRIYVIEDIDCLTDVVLDRTLKHHDVDARRKSMASNVSSKNDGMDGENPQSETESEYSSVSTTDANYLYAPKALTELAQSNFSDMMNYGTGELPQSMVIPGGLLDNGPSGFGGNDIGSNMWSALSMMDDDLAGKKPVNTISPNKKDSGGKHQIAK